MMLVLEGNTLLRLLVRLLLTRRLLRVMEFEVDGTVVECVFV